MTKRNDRLRQAMAGSARQIAPLINDSDKRIVEALLMNPNMPSELIAVMIRRKRFTRDQLRLIAGQKRWINDIKVKLELILNPLTPRDISLKYIKDLFYADLAVVARTVTLHPSIRSAAQNYLKIRLESMRVGERISLAKSATSELLRLLLYDEDFRVVNAALNNYHLTEMDVLQIANDTSVSGAHLALITEHRKWSLSQPVLDALARHPKLGYGHRRMVFEKIRIPALVQLITSPLINKEHQRLARFILHKRIRELPGSMQRSMAGTHSKALLRELALAVQKPDIMQKILNNRRFTKDDVRLMLQKNRSHALPGIILNHPVWKNDEELKLKCRTLMEMIAKTDSHRKKHGEV